MLDAVDEPHRRSPKTLHREVAAVAGQASVLRRILAQWISEQGFPIELTEALEIASYEAMANVVTHAYRHGQVGTMTVTATLDGDVLAVTITDTGQWDDTPSEHAAGRGLPLMRALADEVTVTTAPHRTIVRLIWFWSPPGAVTGSAFG